MRQDDVTAATRALLARGDAAAHRDALRHGAPFIRDEPALTHIDAQGDARMVDVSAKAATERTAVAEGRVVMRRRRWH